MLKSKQSSCFVSNLISLFAFNSAQLSNLSLTCGPRWLPLLLDWWRWLTSLTAALCRNKSHCLVFSLVRAKFGDDRSQFPNILRMLKELAPLYLLRQASPDEWKKVKSIDSTFKRSRLSQNGLLVSVTFRINKLKNVFLVNPTFGLKVFVAHLMAVTWVIMSQFSGITFPIFACCLSLSFVRVRELLRKN